MGEISMSGAQRTYARLAGFMYFFNYLTAMFGTLAPPRIRGSGDFAEKAGRILASEHLYRFALTSMVISWVLIVVLAFALYVTLAPVNKRLAQIALFMELAQACVGAVTVIFSFATLNLRLQAAAPATASFQNPQLDALVSAFGNASGDGFQIAMTFFAVGSTIFFYLFYKSRYIPRPLAALGVFGSIVMMVVTLGTMTFPAYASTLQFGWGPMGVAEVTTAFWLMIRGIRPGGVAGRKFEPALS